MKLTTIILAILLSIGCFSTNEKKRVETETHIVYAKESFEGDYYKLSFTDGKYIECDYGIYSIAEPNDTAILSYVSDGLFVHRFVEIKKCKDDKDE